jgi:L-cysteine:1D-myo-inositol 2-amino-2-deoxy-alpha-D-glucopyranoside ligase
MSKSRGNLVFVSRLLAAGHDPMAVRLAIISHHYRSDWDWTADSLPGAEKRLARWREAARATGPAAPGTPAAAAGNVLDAVRERMADDLDAPGALAVIDDWAATGSAADGSGGLVGDTVDALLGIRL